ncbi:tetratricopeptide repeat protein, partial [Acidobacteriota bacterium]
EAARLNPDSPQPWNTMGAIFLMQGDRSRAVQAFRKALSVDPENRIAKQQLIMIGAIR